MAPRLESRDVSLSGNARFALLSDYGGAHSAARSGKRAAIRMLETVQFEENHNMK